MKTLNTRLIIAALLSLGIAGVLTAASRKPDKADKRVEVVFDHPENFTDAKQDYMGSQSGRDSILDQFRDYLENHGSALVPEDQRLTITFTDIDLAGDFEPWRGPQWDEVRIVKDIYPPRLKFTYKLTDAKGQVIKEDKVELSDLAFMMRLTIDRQDPLHFEKDMLDDWLRSVTVHRKT